MYSGFVTFTQGGACARASWTNGYELTREVHKGGQHGRQIMSQESALLLKRRYDSHQCQSFMSFTGGVLMGLLTNHGPIYWWHTVPGWMLLKTLVYSCHCSSIAKFTISLSLHSSYRNYLFPIQGC